MLYEITAQSFSQNAQAYEIAADITAGQGRSALLFAHGVRAGTGAPDYELSAPAGWTLLGANSSTTTNRRYVTACWVLPEPAAGEMHVKIEATRPLSGMVAFLGLVDAVPGTVIVAAGPAGELLFDNPIAGGGVVYAVTGRPGTVVEGTGTALAQVETEESNTSTAVVGALFAADANEIRATATKGSLLSLLAVPLAASDEPDEPPPPLKLKNEISVIVRDIPLGGSHEVRHVRPDDIVAGPKGIDWENTPYTAFILTNNDEDAVDSD